MAIKILISLSAVILVSSCASYSPALTKEQLSKIKTIDLYHQLENVDEQTEAGYPRPAFAATQSGFVNAFIGSGTDEDNSKKPGAEDSTHRVMSDGYDFESTVFESLRESAEKLTIPLINTALISSEESLSLDYLSDSRADAIMPTRSNYWLPLDDDTLRVSLSYTITPTQSTAHTESENVRRVVFRTRNPDWTRETMMEALQEGANVVAEMLMFDLRDTRPLFEIKKFKTQVNILGEQVSKGIYAYRVGESANEKYTFYRLIHNGDLYALQN